MYSPLFIFIFISVSIAFVGTIIATLVFLMLVIGRIMVRVPFVPTKDFAVPIIIDTLDLKNDSILVDLGCGNAKILSAAAQRFPNTTMIGIEKAPFPYLLAKWKTRNQKNVSIKRGSFYDYDFSRVTHLYLYLFPEILDALLPTFEQKLKVGTIIVSCDFTFAKKSPEKTIDLPAGTNKLSRKLFLYRF